MMKRVFTWLVVLCVATTAALAQQVRATQQLPAHPRLLMLRGEEAAIKHNLAADSLWTAYENTLLASARQVQYMAPMDYKTGQTAFLLVAREQARRIMLDAYAWRMTGNEALAKRCQQEMLRAAAFPDWVPTHYLGTAELTLALALGYDWLYDWLEPDARATICHAIIDKGLRPSLDTRYNSFLAHTNNWNPVCNGSLLIGALAVWETDRQLAAQVVNRSLGKLHIALEQYEPSGALAEGYMYWEYGTSFAALTLSVLQRLFGNTFGLAANQGFMRTWQFELHCVTPGLNHFAFADDDPVTRYRPAMWWFAAQNRNASMLYNQVQVLKKNMRAQVARDNFAPFAAIWASALRLTGLKPPRELNWTSANNPALAIMRTSWTDPRALWAGLKLGRCNTSHGHMDVGSFQIESKGVMWATDLGVENYDALSARGIHLWNMSQNSDRWNVFRWSNKSHNVARFGDRRQVVTGNVTLSGPLRVGSRAVTATANMTPAVAGQVQNWTRSLSLQGNSRCVVTDRVTTGPTATTITWNMATGTTATLTGNRTVRLEKNGQTVTLRFTADVPITLTVTDAKPGTPYETQNQGYHMVQFTATLPPRRSFTFTMTLTN